MNRIFLFVSLVICVITFSCTPPGSGTENDPIDEKPAYLDLRISDVQTVGLPFEYYGEVPTNVSFSVTITNEGRDITAQPEIIIVSIVVESNAAAGYYDIISNPKVVAIANKQTGMKFKEELMFNFNDIDISQYGDIGNNHFYACVFVTNQNTSEFLADAATVDNVDLINAMPCVKKTFVHSSWAAATELAGASTFAAAVTVSEFDHWYSGSTSGSFNYYKLSVDTSSTYDLYWDDVVQGSGNYTADVLVWVMDSSGAIVHNADNGFYAPITFTPTETSVYILVQRSIDVIGTFAFGITER